ncbi:MAG: YARHG domain-containing protein [Cyclobacteriaceae bacterium]|nr:YARHG domain-containing protein [Cyclobacteriaceae bacterium]
MKNAVFFLLFCICLITVTQCTILKKESPEDDARNFLISLQGDMDRTDGEILSKFQVKQTREAILTVIAILQNTDPFIVCDAPFNNAKITLSGETIKAEIPVTFRLKNLDNEDATTSTLTLWLSSRKDSYVVSQVEGEEFYQAYSLIKNRNQWEAEEKLALQQRLWIYENAIQLEQQYDTVIWYATYNNQNYYYVVKDHWENYFLNYQTRDVKNVNAKMGLVDAKGEIIIPMVYELIGSIGFVQPDLVEVMQDGKIGYFNIKTRQLVLEPVFDLIIPYGYNNVWAVVRRDSTYGWLNKEFQFNAGFPSERIEQWFTTFEFLKKSIQLKAGQQTFCEIPRRDFAGSGIIIPPAYLSRYGIFKDIEGNISTTNIPLNGWTDYKETTGSFLERISENINAVVTTIRQRYLDGREEFYNSNTVLFVNKNLDTLGTASLSGNEVSIHPVDSSLLEVRTPHDYWFMEFDVCEESNLFHHDYFAITKDKGIQQLKSKRLFPQTEFVKLDSSYLVGSFHVYDSKAQKEVSSSFLSTKTITFMRDEILASYGYAFPSPDRQKQFQDIGNWYTPTYSKLDDVQALLTDIDRHNVIFLNRVLHVDDASSI